MGLLMTFVFIIGAVVIWLGPEQKGASFRKTIGSP
jgi:hypothetical protein